MIIKVDKLINIKKGLVEVLVGQGKEVIKFVVKVDGGEQIELKN